LSTDEYAAPYKDGTKLTKQNIGNNYADVGEAVMLM
jgi:hypothetical protein